MAIFVRGDDQLVLSPVVHSAPIAKHGLPTDWSFWERLDRRLLQMCDEVLVLVLSGWRESTGVQAEIRIAGELGKAVRFLEPASLATPDSETSPTRTA